MLTAALQIVLMFEREPALELLRNPPPRSRAGAAVALRRLLVGSRGGAGAG